MDIDQTLVSPHLEVLERLFVHERTPLHRKNVFFSRQQDRTGNPCAGALDGIDDFLRALIQDPVVEGTKADADFITSHNLKLLLAHEQEPDKSSPCIE